MLTRVLKVFMVAEQFLQQAARHESFSWIIESFLKEATNQSQGSTFFL